MSLLGQALGNQRARHPRDFYPTIDRRCVPPLVAMMRALGAYPSRFAEPCAGAGDLVDLLAVGAPDLVCEWQSDMLPQRRHVAVQDALLLSAPDLRGIDCLITNFPWRRAMLHPLIAHLAEMIPVYTLLDSGWMATGAAVQLGERYCTDIITCRRLKWFSNRTLDIDPKGWRDGAQPIRFKRPNDPGDDTHWYRFGPDKTVPTRWHWPVPKGDDEQGVLL